MDPAVTQAVPHVRRVLSDFPAGGEEVVPGPAVAQRHRVLVDETPGLDTVRAAVQVEGVRSRAAALAGGPVPGLLLRPARTRLGHVVIQLEGIAVLELVIPEAPAAVVHAQAVFVRVAVLAGRVRL